jgi:hypothetical protein
MFRNGLLIRALAAPRDYPHYRAVVIDVGAFTTDFAVFTFDSGGHNLLLSDIEFQTHTLSVPVGMSMLDDAIVAALKSEHQKYMREEAPATDWARFRQDVFVNRRPFQSPVGEIGGDEERPAIDAAIESFESRLREETNKFLTPLGDIPFKELILTGGGCSVPSVQNTLISGSQAGRVAFRKIHLPLARKGGPQKATTPQQVVEHLEGALPRGGTALGGTSSYFDMVD